MISAAPGLYAQEAGRILPFPVTENDTNSYSLNLVVDASGKPSHFFRNIFTPVCFTGECKPVYINFYWDLLGNYVRYDLPPREELTKMDHDVFEEEDYNKLQEILANPESLLKDIAIEDLVSTGTDNLADSVDAKTGATLKTIKREVIEGAVFTCYTLWHIAYGEIVMDEMKRITASMVSPELLHTFLQSNNYHYQYWALESVIGSDGIPQPAYWADIKGIIGGSNFFAARSTLQKLHPGVLESGETQEWLLGLYAKSAYAFQVAILKRLSEVPVHSRVLETLTRELPSTNQELFELTLKIVGNQVRPAVVPLRQLADALNQLPTARAGEVYGLLTAINPKDKYVQSRLKSYRIQKEEF